MRYIYYVYHFNIVKRNIVEPIVFDRNSANIFVSRFAAVGKIQQSIDFFHKAII